MYNEEGIRRKKKKYVTPNWKTLKVTQLIVVAAASVRSRGKVSWEKKMKPNREERKYNTGNDQSKDNSSRTFPGTAKRFCI